MVPWFSHRVPPWPGTPGILKMIYISRNLMPVGCFTGPTTLDFMKFNISRPRNYGLMDFTTESTESWMCSNGIYIYISRSISAIWLYYLLIHFFIFLLFPHIVQRNWCGSSIDWFGVHWLIRRFVKRKFRKSVVFRKIFLRDRRESSIRIRLIWNKKQKKILLLRHFSSPLPGNNSNKFPINLARDYIRIRRPIVIDSARFIIGNWLEQFDRER